MRGQLEHLRERHEGFGSFNLEHRAQQEIQIAFKVAGSRAGLRGIKACAYEMMNMNLGMLLPVTVNATVALFHAVPHLASFWHQETHAAQKKKRGPGFLPDRA